MADNISDIIDRRQTLNKRFRFTLIDDDTSNSHVLDYAPDGFSNGKMSLTRHKVYRGLFSSFTVDELTFYKDGRDILQYYYQVYGVNKSISLKSEIFTSTGYQDYFTLKLDFATYVINDISVRIQAIDTSFIEKVKNREDVEVNLFSTESIDGVTLTPFTVGLDLVDTSVLYESEFIDGSIAAYYTTPNIVPLSLSTSDYSETASPVNIPNSKYGGFFKNSLATRIMTVSGFVKGQIAHITATGCTAFIRYFLYVKVYDSSNQLISTYKVFTDDGLNTLTLDIEYSQQITLLDGYSAILQSEWALIGDCSASDIGQTYTDCTMSIVETYESLEDVNVQAFGIYEGFLKTIQMYTGINDCFYSESFGRTDTPVVTYASDGILLHIIKGRLLRTPESTMPVKLIDLFKAVNSIYNIGLSIENDRVRVETIDHYYDSAVTLDISDKVTNYIIEKAVDPTKLFKSIEVGFLKVGSTEIESGLEFNTKSKFTTEINAVMNKLNITSPYRADGSSIVRLFNDTDLSTDADGDNDIFLLKSYRDGADLIIETDQQFSDINGIANGYNSLNLDLSLKRSLLRWGNIIRCGQEGEGDLFNMIDFESYNMIDFEGYNMVSGTYQASGTIRWQDTENNYNLSTQKYTETEPVVENADILNVDLDDPLFYPEIYKLTVPLTTDEINTIFTTPNGLIQITDTKTGWIDSMEIDNETFDVTLNLVRNYA